MHAVRRTLAVAGLAGLLLTASAGSAFAAPTPTPDPSASASADPSASPSEAPPAEPSAKPTDGGCAQDPQICESGGVAPSGDPETTTDCDPFAASPPPSGVVCIAGGIRPGTTGTGSGSGAGAPGQLPRTGPAPVLPTLAVGSWLVLLGVLAAIAGRRRTA